MPSLKDTREESTDILKDFTFSQIVKYQFISFCRFQIQNEMHCKFLIAQTKTRNYVIKYILSDNISWSYCKLAWFMTLLIWKPYNIFVPIRFLCPLPVVCEQKVKVSHLESTDVHFITDSGWHTMYKYGKNYKPIMDIF